jgi:hypothetical protein
LRGTIVRKALFVEKARAVLTREREYRSKFAAVLSNSRRGAISCMARS